MTRLAVTPTPGLRLDAVGWGVPHGHTVTNPGADGATAVMFNATAPGASTFVLLHYPDAPKPAQGEVILGFVTDDITTFVRNAAGQPIRVPGDALALAPDGRLLASGDLGGHLYLWAASDPAIAAAVLGATRMCMSQRQRQALVQDALTKLMKGRTLS